MKIIIVLIAMIVSPAISPVNAGIYKWTDESGNIHFGDRPVEQDSATELNIQINNKAGITNSSGNKKDREYLLKQIEKDKETDAKKRDKSANKRKKRKRLCNNYKSRLQTHIQSNRTFTMSPDGKRTYYSEKDRIARKKKLSKAVAKYCR